MDEKELLKIRSLVGNITRNNLKYVDCYISDDLGIFIPSVGFCEYAITPSHTHPSYSFILYLTEETILVQPEFEISEGQFLVTAISPNLPHEEEKADLFRRYIAIMISKYLFESIYLLYDMQKPQLYNWKQFLVESEFLQFINRFMSEYDNKLPGRDNMLKSISSIITHELIRGLLGRNLLSGYGSGRLEIEKVIGYMNQYFGEKLTIKKLAAVANISESHLIRIFKKETAMSPLEYLIKLRINKAKKLLRNRNLRITDISFKCGFNSPSNFSSSFIKHSGMTPSDYQKSFDGE
ncbi:MAG: helix-turn-helix domain-containing protein [Bacillota bacterium]|nr:helix-turn-helix domain-containing protein [Bacillota bacterium]